MFGSLLVVVSAGTVPVAIIYIIYNIIAYCESLGIRGQAVASDCSENTTQGQWFFKHCWLTIPDSNSFRTEHSSKRWIYLIPMPAEHTRHWINYVCARNSVILLSQEFHVNSKIKISYVSNWRITCSPFILCFLTWIAPN